MMDDLWGLAVLLLLLVIVGPFLAIAALVRANRLAEKVGQLQQQLEQLTGQLQRPAPAHKPKAGPESPPEPGAEAAAPELAPLEQASPIAAAAVAAAPTEAPPPPIAEAQAGVATGTTGSIWLERLRRNWMIWLGGICVGLAGVFLVKYGIERGLLSPTARVALGLLTGIGLHIAAEWLRRRSGGSDPVFAALAGGASITLFAALLAALHLYQLMSPLVVFGLLAAVSLLTMLLALAHGPVLAALGILGAFTVPILVSSDSGNIVGAMLYALIVSGAALLLLRYVYRPWLWWGTLAGGLGWWLLSLDAAAADWFRGPYLAVFAWALLAVPRFDWLLLRSGDADVDKAITYTLSADHGLQFSLSRDQLGLLTVLAAWTFSIMATGWDALQLLYWSPLVLVLGIASLRRDELGWLPWLTLCAHWSAWLFLATDPAAFGQGWVLERLPEPVGDRALYDMGLFAVLYAGIGALQIGMRGNSHPRLALALVSPIGWLVLAYLLVNGIAQSMAWSLAAAFAGLVYAAIAAFRLERGRAGAEVLWLAIGTHLAYALAVSMFFREASLTLALAVQLISLTWLIRKYQLGWLAWMVRGVLAIVAVRLTLNPWLATYPVDIHWSLWTYGGSTVCAALASWLARGMPDLRRWLEVGALHLLVLTLGAELRYWLYDGHIFSWRYDLTEAAINTALWAGLSLVYHARATLDAALAPLFRQLAHILLLLALASYALAVTWLNPWWSDQAVSATPLFNLLLPAYGLPVVLALLVARYHDAVFRSWAYRVAGVGLLLFVTLEIRHLWQGQLDLFEPVSDGELYTYSIVWLVLAIVASLAGMRWSMDELYKAGMVLLAVVIAKIFLVDMSDLEGLWRVASFMGLGLSLLGLAWLHGRIRPAAIAPGPADVD
jgi:uncharacterized membrane protein